MKVKVYYTIAQEALIEVDDKFAKTANDDWYFENHQEGNDLLTELDCVLSEKLPKDASIYAVWSENDENLFYEQ